MNFNSLSHKFCPKDGDYNNCLGRDTHITRNSVLYWYCRLCTSNIYSLFTCMSSHNFFKKIMILCSFFNPLLSFNVIFVDISIIYHKYIHEKRQSVIRSFRIVPFRMIISRIPKISFYSGFTFLDSSVPEKKKKKDFHTLYRHTFFPF